jgi:UDP-N-acetyl-D-glucosamine dehydrogenase
MKMLASHGPDIGKPSTAATKPGFSPSTPVPPGGHCIPIDPFYPFLKAKEWDFRIFFIELAGEINIGMPFQVLEHVAILNRHKKHSTAPRCWC